MLIFLLALTAACATVMEPTNSNQLTIDCATPRPQLCTMEYRPVCALRDTGIRCVTTPCDSTEQVTYSNACSACADEKVYSYQAEACDQ